MSSFSSNQFVLSLQNTPMESTMTAEQLEKNEWLRLPVVSAGAEFLVMGFLMRRNILTYKAPPNNEGYDLICIHPDPRYKPTSIEKAQLRIQVKSRYATDCNKSFPIKEKSLDAFDYLIAAFLNIGKFYGKNTGNIGAKEIEFYTLSKDFIRAHHHKTTGWEKVMLNPLQAEIEKYKNELGFELIANELGIDKPVKNR